MILHAFFIFISVTFFFSNTENFQILCNATPYQTGMPYPASENAIIMMQLYDNIFLIITLILCTVLFILDGIRVQGKQPDYSKPKYASKLSLIKAPIRAKAFSHAQHLEIFWTVIPALILLGIAAPTFATLYFIDDMPNPALVLKIIGHQWYWSYEYTNKADNLTGQFSAYMVSTKDLELGHLRLLDTDNTIYLPILTDIRLLVTSSDVLHSWAVPSFGVKVDACPGRLTQASLRINHHGLFFGQCSEICGINHGFMPIKIHAVKV